MRVTFCHLISLAILFSSVFVSAGPTPDNSCSSCWIAKRNELQECQNIPQTEINDFSKLSDEEIVAKQDKFPKLIPCLCALVPKVPSILKECNCNADDSKGLTKESQIVKNLCSKAIDDDNKSAPKPATNTTSTSNNKPKNDDKPADGTGASTSGDASADGYDYGNSTTSSTNTTGSGSTPVPAKSAAISVQWSGSFIVTLGAVGVALAL